MPKTQVQLPLLDLYPNAAVAYSLRKLRTDYGGNAVRVRRSIDNTEQDLGFNILGELDTENIADWVGYNLLTFSEQLQNTAYVKTRLTVSQDALTAPDSMMTADILFETAEDGNHIMSRTLSVIAGQSYTYSFFAKSNGRDFIRVVTSNTLSQNPGVSAGVAWIDITNGVILSENTGFVNGPDTSNLTVTDVGNGWFEISFTMPCSTTGTPNALSINLSPDTVFTTPANATLNYVGDVTKGVSIWGIQISQTSTVKPYEKTEATAGGAAFITTWYDQSGNANHATQATAANQAQIVLNSTVITDPNTGKNSTTWTSDSYSLTTGISPNTRYLSIGVIDRTANTINIASLGSGTIGGTNGQQPLIWLATTGGLRSDMSSTVTHGTNTNTGTFITTSEKNGSDLKTVYLNGGVSATTATEVPSAGNNFIYFGRTGSNTTSGRYTEYIYWDSDQSTNRVGIETNINSHYNIYS
jgi:hypothetical protein